MKLLLRLIIVMLGTGLWAQEGYSLEFNFSKIDQDSLELSVYSGTSKKYYTVSTISCQKRNVAFTESKKIIDAVYRINFKGADDKDYLNIVVDNGADIAFELNGEDIQKIRTKDPINSLFMQAQRSSSVSERTALYRMLVQRYPKSVAALYAQLELKQMQAKPDVRNRSAGEKFQENYFEGIDLDDKRIALLPNIYSSLFDYIKVLPINSTNYNKAVDRLLEGQNCESRNYLFYLEWFFMNMEYLNRYHLYESFMHVFNSYFNKGECILKDQKLYDRMVQKLQNYEKVPIGSTLPDFEMVDRNGKKMKISEVYPKHSYTFIAFYDPDCSHCKIKMPEINKYFSLLDHKMGSIDVQQIAFLNANSDYAWEYFINQHHLTHWMHVKSEDPSYQYIRDLDVFANPAFFLIDQNGTILMKNYIPDEMDILFKNQSP